MPPFTGRRSIPTPEFRQTGIKPENSAPCGAPEFTLGELKAAVPKHCFERNTLTSLRYVAQDILMAAILYKGSTFIDVLAEANPLAAYVLWPMYWWWQGAVLTGLWVIAHECGHRAFSDSIAFGDFVGIILHSFLLVPYHSWRISHAKHHQNTNSMEKDQVFVPYTLEEVGEHPTPWDESGMFSGIVRFGDIAKMLLFGWPAYLFTHATGRKYKEKTSHFDPKAPLFDKKDRADVLLSDIMLLSVIAVLAFTGHTHGWTWLAKVYFVPYLIVNMWLVMITDLQHTDPRLPHYRASAYNWLKGAVCTIDRDYGVMNFFHHHIADTHVAHHLFSHMPHYHAEEATAAIRPLLGDYYLVDDVSPGLVGIAEALWKTSTHCRFVTNDGDILWWCKEVADKDKKSA